MFWSSENNLQNAEKMVMVALLLPVIKYMKKKKEIAVLLSLLFYILVAVCSLGYSYLNRFIEI